MAARSITPFVSISNFSAVLTMVSARDYGRYEDGGVNWRVVEGYGAAIAAHAAGVPVVFGAPVRRY